MKKKPGAMNHEVYANPNENDQILINILCKDKEIYMPTL